MPKRKLPIFSETDFMEPGVRYVDVPGFEGRYLVSDKGEIISKKRINTCKNGIKRIESARKIKPNIKKNGYAYIILKSDSKTETRRLHRVVANAFIPNPNNYEQVNHLDGNKLNNCVANLEWCTQSENLRHAYANNLIKHYTKKVLKCDGETGLVLEEFPSMIDAVKSVYGRNGESARCMISMCCNGRIRKAYGFIWKFKDERQTNNLSK